ncbi:MAG: hypothetical protein LBC53_03185 [Spirochaetaceae bacterium]|jgi:hypothetical protein|nr:hypothetical protein [Spirochaetaceae bacterium]
MNKYLCAIFFSLVVSYHSPAQETTNVRISKIRLFIDDVEYEWTRSGLILNQDDETGGVEAAITLKPATIISFLNITLNSDPPLNGLSGGVLIRKSGCETAVMYMKSRYSLFLHEGIRKNGRWLLKSVPVIYGGMAEVMHGLWPEKRDFGENGRLCGYMLGGTGAVLNIYIPRQEGGLWPWGDNSTITGRAKIKANILTRLETGLNL